MLTVLVGGRGMLLCLVVPPVIVMVGGHAVMVRGGFMMGGRVVVMIARCVLGLCHEYSSLRLIGVEVLRKSAPFPVLAQAWLRAHAPTGEDTRE
jgi:hypothetical protein